MQLLIHDCALHCEERGVGRPLILLHGNGEDGGYFKDQIDFFAKYYRVIALDTRGHGKSERGGECFSIDRFAEDLNEVYAALKLERAHLLGFSDGGNIAMAFALKYPRKVKTMVLNGANLFPSGVKLSVQLPILCEYAIACISSLWSGRASRKRELLGLMVNQPHVKPKELRQILIPTLVITGDRDMIRDSHTKLLAAALPHSERVVIEGSHFIAAENPGAFNAAVKDFLDRKG